MVQDLVLEMVLVVVEVLQAVQVLPWVVLCDLPPSLQMVLLLLRFRFPLLLVRSGCLGNTKHCV